ncbi:MAG: ABC transporter ATP-binding protein [Candidatus Promineifilaceae bacterium]
MYTIETHQLTRDYDDVRAVDHITFAAEAGEIFGFLGPNGAGKTTTIKMLTGQLRPTGGHATVCGCDVVTQRQLLKPAIGVVFEYQNIYERMSARNNLRFSARLYGINSRRVQEVLQQVGLQDQAKKKTADFSNGMKQRLLIARALLHQPQVLFLDEPTRGLDPGVVRDIRAIIRELKSQGVTVFLTTHYMEEADRLCDRVAILHNGRIVALDTPQNLKDNNSQENATLEDVFLSLTGYNLEGQALTGYSLEGQTQTGQQLAGRR